MEKHTDTTTVETPKKVEKQVTKKVPTSSEKPSKTSKKLEKITSNTTDDEWASF